MPLVATEEQQARSRSVGLLKLTIVMAVIILALPLLPFFKPVEVRYGSIFLTLKVARLSYGDLPQGFIHETGRAGQAAVYLLHLGDWSHQVWNSKYSIPDSSSKRNESQRYLRWHLW